MRRFQFLVLAGLATLTLSAPAHGADPLPFVTFDDTCEPASGATLFYGDPEPAAHPDVIMRYEVTGGAATLDGHPMVAGDVIWGLGEALTAGEEPALIADCTGEPQQAPFTAAFADRPSVPTAFLGSGTLAGSTLGFVAPAAVPYAADITVQDGRIAVQSPDRGGAAVEFGGAGTFALGILPAGARTLSVRAVEGPRPTWKIGLRALPVTLSGTAVAERVVSLKAPLRVTYTLDGEARVKGVLTRLGMTPRPGAILDASQSAGTHTFEWSPYPASRSGAHALDLTAVDPNGNVSSASVQFVIDVQPPYLGWRSGPTVLDNAAIRLTAWDAAGARAVEISEPGRPEDALQITPEPPDEYVVRPRAGRWGLGMHTLRITATDPSDNRSETTFSFTAVRALGTPCGQSAAKTAVATTRSVRERLAQTKAARGRNFLAVYRLARLVCRDLTGDGLDEMIVLLRARSATAPTPVIVFKGLRSGTWPQRYMTTRHRVGALRPRGRAVVLRAAGGRAYEIRAHGTAFRLRRR